MIAGGRQRRSTCIVACAASFVVFLDVTIVNVGFRSIERSFSSASQAEVALILTAYAAALGAMLLPGGKLTDHLGPRRMFLLSFSVFGLASLCCGCALSVEMLIGARVCQAAAAGCVAPASLALMFLVFPSTRRAYVVGLWSGTAGAAALAGPALGGLLVESTGWRSVFLVNVPIAAAAFAFGRAHLRDTGERGPRPDTLVAGLAALAAGLLTAALFQATSAGWRATSTTSLFAVAAACAVLCAIRGRIAGNALIGMELLADRSLQVSNAATLLTSVAGFGLMFINMLFLTTIWDFSALQLGLALCPGPIVTAVIAVPAGRLADRFGTGPIAAPGAVLLAAGAMWFAMRTGQRPAWVSTWLPGSLLTGSGIGLCFPTLGASAIAVARPGLTGTAVALNGSIRQIGAVAGITAALCISRSPSTSAAALGAFHRGWRFVVVVALTGGLVSLALLRRDGDSAGRGV